ncbi:hypothetical protein D3C73_1479290 [compost metagenome]
MIVINCIEIEEEFGPCKSDESRLMNYQIALKANSLLDKKENIDLLEFNLKYSNLI